VIFQHSHHPQRQRAAGERGEEPGRGERDDERRRQGVAEQMRDEQRYIFLVVSIANRKG
jgi:hypothetical protein